MLNPVKWRVSVFTGMLGRRLLLALTSIIVQPDSECFCRADLRSDSLSGTDSRAGVMSLILIPSLRVQVQTVNIHQDRVRT